LLWGLGTTTFNINVPTGALQEVLLQQVTQQGDNLHFVALAAAQTDTGDVPDMAKTLMQDLEVSVAGAPI